MAVNYRLLAIFASVVCAVFSAFSLVWIIEAFAMYRGEDFIIASETMDWMHPPGEQDATCVETITDAQLMTLDYDDKDVECRLANDVGIKQKMRNSLAVSVHGMYYVWKNKEAELYEGDKPNPKYTQEQVQDALKIALSATVTSVAYPEVIKTTPGAKPAGVSIQNGYLALHYVDDRPVPTNCDTIYGKTYEDIENDADLMYYIDNIRKGRSVDQFEIGKVVGVKGTWPLADLRIDCNDNNKNFDPDVPYIQTPGVGEVDVDDPAALDALVPHLHAHCYAQFLFGSVGTVNNEGAFTVPLPGREPGPLYLPYAMPVGFNETTPYSQKVRLYLGYRYGMAMWAYVPMLLTTCVLLGDAIVFFFSEITMPAVLNDMGKYTTDRLKHAQDSLVIAADVRASRCKRFALCSTAVGFSFFFYFFFIGGPWGVFYSVFPRPSCEKDGDGMGSDPSHNPNFDFGLWKGTKGGWKTDWDATWYELAALANQVFVLLFLPFTTTTFGRNINKSIAGGDAAEGRKLVAGLRDGLQRVNTSSRYVKYQKDFIWPLLLGVLVMIIGQSISNADFGFAWAEGVLAIKKDEYDVPFFDEVRIAALVYDQGVATFAVVVACGLILGSVIARRYISGLGCFSGIVFIGWLVLTLIFFFPLLVYASMRAIFNHDEANNDCSVFNRDHFSAKNDLCIARYWTFIGGGTFTLLTVLLLTAFGIPNVIKGVVMVRKQADVVYKPEKSGSRFFREGPAMQTRESLYDAEELSTPLSGYQSAEESSGSASFFDFKTNLGKTDSNVLLYAPRMGASSRR